MYAEDAFFLFAVFLGVFFWPSFGFTETVPCIMTENSPHDPLPSDPCSVEVGDQTIVLSSAAMDMLVDVSKREGIPVDAIAAMILERNFEKSESDAIEVCLLNYFVAAARLSANPYRGLGEKNRDAFSPLLKSALEMTCSQHLPRDARKGATRAPSDSEP